MSKEKKPTLLNAIPTPLTRGIGPFYPIRKAQPFTGTIERKQLHGKAHSRQQAILLGSPHLRFLLAANNELFKNHYPNEMSRFDTTIYKMCGAMGLAPTGPNYKRVKTLLDDWQQIRFNAVMPYRDTVFKFGHIMVINYELVNWGPKSKIHIIFNRPYLEAVMQNFAVYFNMNFLNQFTDGYSPIIYSFIQGQKAFYDNKVCKVFNEQLEDVLGLPYMGLTSAGLRDARKAIRLSITKTLRARGYFYDVKDHGHFYAVTAAWEHTAEGSKKRKVLQPQPQVAAAVPTDKLTEAGRKVMDWWEAKHDVITAKGDKEAVYNKVGHWLDKFINQYGYKISDPHGGIRDAQFMLSSLNKTDYSQQEYEEYVDRCISMFRAGVLHHVDELLERQVAGHSGGAVPTIGWVNQEQFWFNHLVKYMADDLNILEL